MMEFDFNRTALLEIDLQYDFCPAGALAVAEGDQVIEPLNRLARQTARAGGQVIATQDWHPAGHCSFASARPGAPWPDHCVQGTPGAAFHRDLDLSPVRLILRKGWRPELDSYSAFFENDRQTATGLDGYLKGLAIRTLLVGGLATDYCVLYTVMDALRLGYQVWLAAEAMRPVDQAGGEAALAQMLAAGARCL